MISIGLSSLGNLILTVPGPGGSSRNLPLVYAVMPPFPTEEQALAIHQANGQVLAQLVGYLEAQARAGELRPWLDATKPLPPVQILPGQGKARKATEPASLATRAALGIEITLEDLGL